MKEPDFLSVLARRFSDFLSFENWAAWPPKTRYRCCDPSTAFLSAKTSMAGGRFVSYSNVTPRRANTFSQARRETGSAPCASSAPICARLNRNALFQNRNSLDEKGPSGFHTSTHKMR
jgi:hypothetical protein